MAPTREVIPTDSSLQLIGLAVGLLWAAVVAGALWRLAWLFAKFLGGMSRAQETFEALTRSIQSRERRPSQ